MVQAGHLDTSSVLPGPIPTHVEPIEWQLLKFRLLRRGQSSRVGRRSWCAGSAVGFVCSPSAETELSPQPSSAVRGVDGKERVALAGGTACAVATAAAVWAASRVAGSLSVP